MLTAERSVKSRYLCAWLDSVVLHGYSTRITEVYHLIAKHDEATDAQRKLAGTLHKIRNTMHCGESDKALALLSVCKSDPTFSTYKTVFGLLEEQCTHEVNVMAKHKEEQDQIVEVVPKLLQFGGRSCPSRLSRISALTMSAGTSTLEADSTFSGFSDVSLNVPKPVRLTLDVPH